MRSALPRLGRWAAIALAAYLLAFDGEGKADQTEPWIGRERPAPHVERQLDQLRREGAVDPLTRRRLADELRQSGAGPEQRRGERTLEQLPDTQPPLREERSVPSRGTPPATLPSTLPRGFGTYER